MPRRGYRKPDSEALTERLEVRFTSEQMKRLRLDADACGLTLAAYARAALNGKPARRKPSRVAHETVRQLAAIGNNLNQLAYKANAGNFPVEAEVRSTLDAVIGALTQIADDR